MPRLLASLLLALPAACGGGHAPLPVVDRVELDRYFGTWYEIARYPAPFQEGCTATTATYAPRDGGGIEVVNRCRVGRPDGEPRDAEGRARVVEGSGGAKLEVTFFWPFWGDYWVLMLDEDYRWAVVGEPRRRYLWILSRSPALPDGVMERIEARLPELGYDPGRLLVTQQPPR